MKNHECNLDIQNLNFKNKVKIKNIDPISILEEEHKHILNALQDVEDSISKEEIDINDLTKIESAARLFIEANKHHEREEKVLFPAVEKKGFSCAPEQMRIEHLELKKLKKELKEAVENKKFEKIKHIGNELVPILREHIWKEDNILYPTARNLLSKKEIAEMRKGFDKIGYCCFHPK